MKEKKYFKKEIGGSANAKKRFSYGVRGGRPSSDCSDRENRDYESIINETFSIYTIYKYAQDRFDKAIFDAEKAPEAISELVDVVTYLTGLAKEEETQVLSPQDAVKFRTMGAKTYDESICSQMILLEEALTTLDKANEKDPEYKESFAIVKEQQDRFLNYKENRGQPVDDNADMFVSYLIPMLLAYHGYKVDKSFAKILADELANKGISVKNEIKQIAKDANAGKVLTVESENKVENPVLASYKEFGIETMFNKSLQSKDGKQIASLFAVAKAYVTQDFVDENAISKLKINSNIKQYLMITLKLANNEKDDKIIKDITQKFNGLTAEQKQTDEGAVVALLYSPIHYLATLEEQKKAKESKKTKKQESVKQPKLKSNKTVTKIFQTVENKENPIANTVKDKPQETTEETKKPKKERKPRTKKAKDEAPILGHDFDDVMLNYAKHLFMTQKDYDLINLSKVKIENITLVCGEEVKTETYLFEDLLKSTKQVIIDGKEERILKSLAETYIDLREEFNSLDKGVQIGLLKGLKYDGKASYVDAAKQQIKDMISNYDNLSDENKKIVKEIAKFDAGIAEDLKAGLMEAKRLKSKREKIAAKEKARDFKIMEEIMEKYNLTRPVKTSKEEADKSIETFFNEQMQ